MKKILHRKAGGFIPEPVPDIMSERFGIPPHGCKRPRGFTIMELIIVVVIIGVLAAVALPSYRIQMLKMKNQEAVRVLMYLWEAQKEFAINNNGAYCGSEFLGDFSCLAVDAPPPLKNFKDLTLTTIPSFFPTCNVGPKLYLARTTANDDSYGLYVLRDGRIVCTPCVSSLCKKMGFKDDW